MAGAVWQRRAGNAAASGSVGSAAIRPVLRTCGIGCSTALAAWQPQACKWAPCSAHAEPPADETPCRSKTASFGLRVAGTHTRIPPEDRNPRLLAYLRIRPVPNPLKQHVAGQVLVGPEGRPVSLMSSAGPCRGLGGLCSRRNGCPRLGPLPPALGLRPAREGSYASPRGLKALLLIPTHQQG